MILQLVPRSNASRFWTSFAPILALFLTIFLGGIAFYALHVNPIEGLYSFFIKPFTNVYSIGDILLKASPLLLIALGLSIGFRANIWNIGAEGQFIMAVIASSSVALLLYGQSHWYTLPLMVIAGVIAAMAWAAIPALLKIHFNTNEILVSLMLVYVSKPFLAYLVNGPYKDPDGAGFAESRWFGEFVSLPILNNSLQLNISIPIALLLAGFIYFLLTRSFIGFQIKVVGLTPPAAGYAGFSERRIIWFSFLFAGFCVGLAGAFEAAGPLGQLTISGPVQNYGFTAIIVAFLGRLHPLSMIFAAFFMALTYVGGVNLQTDLSLPKAVAEVFQGGVLFLILACDVFIRYRFRLNKSPKIKEEK
ncbi:MAG: ABC transporter permease [Alphaproteobacteria bacterium]